MKTPFRIRTVESLHPAGGLWSSTAFIHNDGEPEPVKILLHAGKSRDREEARRRALRAAARCVGTLDPRTAHAGQVRLGI